LPWACPRLSLGSPGLALCWFGVGVMFLTRNPESKRMIMRESQCPLTCHAEEGRIYPGKCLNRTNLYIVMLSPVSTVRRSFPLSIGMESIRPENRVRTEKWSINRPLCLSSAEFKKSTYAGLAHHDFSDEEVCAKSYESTTFRTVSLEIFIPCCLPIYLAIVSQE